MGRRGCGGGLWYLMVVELNKMKIASFFEEVILVGAWIVKE